MLDQVQADKGRAEIDTVEDHLCNEGANLDGAENGLRKTRLGQYQLFKAGRFAMTGSSGHWLLESNDLQYHSKRNN